MKRVVSLAVMTAIAFAATPAFAKSKRHHYHHRGFVSAPYYGAPFVSRNVSDPSFGSRAAYNNATRSGRCVTDLGYGRYEYCGW